MKAARCVPGLFAGALLLATALPVHAQIDDTRWLPFIGCWEPAGESAEAGLLCFRPSDGGVEMTSVLAGEVVATEQLVSDGQRRAVVAEGCDGWESVSFSEDGRRAFTSTELTCADGTRSGTGVMAMVAPNRWVDVRSIDVQGEKVAWVQVYVLVGFDRLNEAGVFDPQAAFATSVRPARLAASREIDIDDVIEAVDRMDTEAVVAWIASQRDPFDIDGAEIIRLADSGVPESVIDVVVAVSYPDRFVVAAEQAIARTDPRLASRRIGFGYGSYMMWNPFYGYGSRYSVYGYGSYGYGGYGYGGYGPTYGGYGYVPATVTIERRPSGGRVINGRGYSRGSAGDGRVAATRGGTFGGGGGWSGSSGGGGSRASGSSGSSGSSSGRTAKPRGGQ